MVIGPWDAYGQQWGWTKVKFLVICILGAEILKQLLTYVSGTHTHTLEDSGVEVETLNIFLLLR